MKTEDLKNLSLQEIVVALQQQNLQKQDFVVPSRFVRMQDSKLQVINRDCLDGLSEILLSTGISFDEDALQKMELQLIKIKILNLYYTIDENTILVGILFMNKIIV